MISSFNVVAKLINNDRGGAEIYCAVGQSVLSMGYYVIGFMLFGCYLSCYFREGERVRKLCQKGDVHLLDNAVSHAPSQC